MPYYYPFVEELKPVVQQCRTPTEAIIHGKRYRILPLAHPRQIGGLGSHSSNWNETHQEWERRIK